VNEIYCNRLQSIQNLYYLYIICIYKNRAYSEIYLFIVYIFTYFLFVIYLRVYTFIYLYLTI